MSGQFLSVDGELECCKFPVAVHVDSGMRLNPATRDHAELDDLLRNSRIGFTVFSMNFVTTISRDEDGKWISECPSIPGCVSQGETREEALENIREAIAGCIEVRAELGMPLTVETHSVEVASATDSQRPGGREGIREERLGSGSATRQPYYSGSGRTHRYTFGS